MILLKAVKHTFPVKDVLSKNNFKWNRKDQCWEKVFATRKEYYKFMFYFLDDEKFNDIGIHEHVEFKAFYVDEEDLKPDHVKELEALQKNLMQFEEIKSVQEIKENGRLGLRIEAKQTRIYWYEDVNIHHLKSEIDGYESILRELKRFHMNYVKEGNENKLFEERMIEFLSIPLYKFLILKKKKLCKWHRNYYENEIDIINKHIPKKIKPVENNEINDLKSE